MERKLEKALSVWLNESQRKPVVIRGARQVGKTWLVRHFATTHHLQLVEMNLEKTPRLASLFVENDPARIFVQIQATFIYR